MNSKQSSSGSSRKNDQSSGKRQPKNMRFDNEKIIERFKKKVPNKTMLETRKGLPAWNEQENILKALDNHQVLVVSGMTGCGKSTQVPQYILDASLSIGKDFGRNGQQTSDWQFPFGGYVKTLMILQYIWF